MVSCCTGYQVQMVPWQQRACMICTCSKQTALLWCLCSFRSCGTICRVHLIDVCASDGGWAVVSEQGGVGANRQAEQDQQTCRRLRRSSRRGRWSTVCCPPHNDIIPLEAVERHQLHKFMKLTVKCTASVWKWFAILFGHVRGHVDLCILAFSCDVN